MKEKYGIMIPRRLKDRLKDDNFIESMKKMSNDSGTMGEMESRVPEGFSELLLLVEKMPREQLYALIPPEKFGELFSKLLSDPEELILAKQLHEQGQLISRLENERPEGGGDSLVERLKKISDTFVKELDKTLKQDQAPLKAHIRRLNKKKPFTDEIRKEIDRTMAAMSEIQPSDEDRNRIKLKVEEELLAPYYRQKLKEVEEAKAKYKELEQRYHDYLARLESKTLEVVKSVSRDSIQYCIQQIPKVVRVGFVEMMKGPLHKMETDMSSTLNEMLLAAKERDAARNEKAKRIIKTKLSENLVNT